MAWTAGQVVTASQLNTYAPQEWTAYVPTITNVTSSTVTARYIRYGQRVEVRVVFTLTAAPSGTVSVSLPVTASAAFGTGIHFNIGGVTGLRQGVGYRVGAAYLASSTTVSFVTDNTAAGWNATVPVSWANTDIWSFVCSYEAA